MPPKQTKAEADKEAAQRQYDADAADARMDKLAAEAERKAEEKAKAEEVLKAIKVEEKDVKAVMAALALTEAQATRRLQEHGASVEKVIAHYVSTGAVSAVPLGQY